MDSPSPHLTSIHLPLPQRIPSLPPPSLLECRERTGDNVLMAMAGAMAYVVVLVVCEAIVSEIIVFSFLVHHPTYVQINEWR